MVTEEINDEKRESERQQKKKNEESKQSKKKKSLTLFFFNSCFFFFFFSSALSLSLFSCMLLARLVAGEAIQRARAFTRDIMLRGVGGNGGATSRCSLTTSTLASTSAAAAAAAALVVGVPPSCPCSCALLRSSALASCSGRLKTSSSTPKHRSFASGAVYAVRRGGINARASAAAVDAPSTSTASANGVVSFLFFRRVFSACILC